MSRAPIDPLVIVGTIRNTVAAVATFDRHYGMDQWDWSEDDFPGTDDPYDLDGMLLEVQRVIRAAQFVKTRIEEAFQADVAANGAIRVGDTVYGDKPNRHRVLQDPDGLADFLGDDWRQGIRVSMGNVRISGVKGVAESRGLAPEMIEDTFFGWEGEDTRVLSVLPVSGRYTPKWAQRLKEGERRET